MKKDAKQDENKKNEAKTRAEQEKNTSRAPSQHGWPAREVARPGRATMARPCLAWPAREPRFRFSLPFYTVFASFFGTSSGGFLESFRVSF